MKLKINKKVKLIDVVYYDGRYDYLLFRLEELNNSVDYFVILEVTNENNYDSSISENFEKVLKALERKN